MPTRTIERSDEGLAYTCSCGWRGRPGAVDDWLVDRERDRLVRRCPGCGDAVPEWGTFCGLAGVERIARGDVAAALERD